MLAAFSRNLPACFAEEGCSDLQCLLPALFLVMLAAFSCRCMTCRGRLVPGHSVIVPTEHVASTRQVDEQIWTEMRNFKKCLLQMHMAQVSDAALHALPVVLCSQCLCQLPVERACVIIAEFVSMARMLQGMNVILIKAALYLGGSTSHAAVAVASVATAVVASCHHLQH